jgi:hypothetical protein
MEVLETLGPMQVVRRQKNIQWSSGGVNLYMEDNLDNNDEDHQNKHM